MLPILSTQVSLVEVLNRIAKQRRIFGLTHLFQVIFKDLNYITNVWSNTCFDLWEEVNALHFFTLMVQRRALLTGANYAARNGQSNNNYTSVASSISSKIDTFWSSSDGYIVYSQDYSSGVNYKSSGLDIAVLLGAIHGGMGDGK
jgi:glucoamylase